MKAIYIYNPYSNNEILLLEQIKSEMSSYIDIISINDLPLIMKKYIRQTPALIPISDSIQGKHLLDKDTDGKLFVTNILYKVLEADEKMLYKEDYNRVNELINSQVNQKTNEFMKEKSTLENQLIIQENKNIGGIL